MEEKTSTHINSCSFAGLRPFVADLPNPPVAVKEKNLAYANLLSVDYCGFVSELSAITQYINNENRLSLHHCSVARTLLGIAMAEMMHLQTLGELIVLLGGSIDYVAKLKNGERRMWTPNYLTLTDCPRKMLADEIEAEKNAIAQYQLHISMIEDECVNAVLARIIEDETYHIALLKALQKEF